MTEATFKVKFPSYNPDQKSLGQLTKCQLTKHYFEVGSHLSIFRAPFPQSNIGMDESTSTLCLEWRVGSGAGVVDRKTIVWQKYSVPKLLNRIVGI